ncbi:MAG: DegT/DnrJ/EryC1/StrS family aminotransferase [Nitrososphaerota archaeon]
MLAIHGGEKVRKKPYPQWPIWTSEEEEYLIDVLRSGKWGIGGKRVEEFASVFASYQGCRYGVACMNGSVAIKVALQALGVGDGDEVITTPYTFIATASAAIELGAIPVFADIEDEGLNISPKRIEEKITERTKVILPVHIAGYPSDMEGISRIAKMHGLGVVEDAAQGHGSEWMGKRLGSLGDLGCFSFQSSKVMTSGEGGAITTNDEELAEKCRSLINVGRTRGGDWYQHDFLGYNYRMTEFQAAVLLAQLRRLDEQIEKRRRNYEMLSSLLKDLEGFELIPPPEGATRVNHFFVPIRIRREVFREIDKKRIVEVLRAEGIPSSPGYTVPLHLHAPIQRYLERKMNSEPVRERLRNAEAAARDVFWLPHYVLLGSEEDVMDIYRALAKIERHRGEL